MHSLVLKNISTFKYVLPMGKKFDLYVIDDAVSNVVFKKIKYGVLLKL